MMVSRRESLGPVNIAGFTPESAHSVLGWTSGVNSGTPHDQIEHTLRASGEQASPVAIAQIHTLKASTHALSSREDCGGIQWAVGE